MAPWFHYQDIASNKAISNTVLAKNHIHFPSVHKPIIFSDDIVFQPVFFFYHYFMAFNLLNLVNDPFLRANTFQTKW